MIDFAGLVGELGRYQYELIALIVALVLAILSSVTSFLRRLGISREISISTFRCIVQLLVMAVVFVFIFEARNVILTVTVLGIMVLFGAHTAASRFPELPGAWKVSLASIVAGTVAVLPILVATDISPIDRPEFMIPIGGMAVGNSMNRCALGFNRLKAELKAHRLKIESALALGAPARIAAHTHLRDSTRASLIPTMDNLKSMGLVWIPGAMTGMLIAGADPIEAASLQIVIVFMILFVGVVSSTTAVSLMGKKMFTDAEQLKRLDDGKEKKGAVKT